MKFPLQVALCPPTVQMCAHGPRPVAFNVVVRTTNTVHEYQAIGYHSVDVEQTARDHAGEEPVGITVTPMIRLQAAT